MHRALLEHDRDRTFAFDEFGLFALKISLTLQRGSPEQDESRRE